LSSVSSSIDAQQPPINALSVRTNPKLTPRSDGTVSALRSIVCNDQRSMTVVLLCTDGSPAATDALRAGLAVLDAAERTIVATVIEPFDPSLVTGTGFAGGVVTPDQAVRDEADRRAAAQTVLDATVEQLNLSGAETVIIEGKPGPAICDLAAEIPAGVVVLGTRGHGGIRRAVLGSVSDHVVRNAPCPVLTTSVE
jgi:nucleotide-binding universal stress UspA family protein